MILALEAQIPPLGSVLVQGRVGPGPVSTPEGFWQAENHPVPTAGVA